MIIQELASGPFNVESVLAVYRGADGFADLSGANWRGSLVVIKGLEFNRIRLEDCEIKPNFVECTFSDSHFIRVFTDNHFWGSNCRWSQCTFLECELKNLRSPGFVFENCVFERTRIDDYRAYETVFKSCTFLECEFRLVRAVTGTWSTGRKSSDPNLEFEACSFQGASFVNCNFNQVAFRNCSFDQPRMKDCSFTGVQADSRWWPQEANVDLFVAFLDELIPILAKRIGTQSRSVGILNSFRESYVSGTNSSRDYSAGLYGGSVPDDELDIVEEILDDVAPRFGL